MDLNHLLEREQTLLIRAHLEPAFNLREKHLSSAADYGARIRSTGYPHRAPLLQAIASRPEQTQAPSSAEILRNRAAQAAALPIDCLRGTKGAGRRP